MDEKLIADLKAKHGVSELTAVTSRDGTTCVFMPPSAAVFDRWMNQRDKGDPSAAAREIASACLVHPERDVMISAIAKQPALLMGVNGYLDTVLAMAGMEQGAAVQKKL